MPMDIRHFFGGAAKKKTSRVGPNKNDDTKKKNRLVFDDSDNDEEDPKAATTSPASIKEEKKVASPPSSKKRKSKQDDDAVKPETTVAVSPGDFFASASSSASPKKKVKTEAISKEESPVKGVNSDRSPSKRKDRQETKEASGESPRKRTPSHSPTKKATPKRSPAATRSPVKSAKLPQKNGSRLKPERTASSVDTDKLVPECLAGFTFVFSGVLDNLSRDDAMDLIKICGGRVTTGVSGKTDYLVVGDILEDGRPYTEGTKFKTAVAKGTCIVKGDEALYGLILQFNDRAAGTTNSSPSASDKKPPPPQAEKTTVTTSKEASAPSAAKPMNPYAKPVRSNPYARPVASASSSVAAANPYAKKPSTGTQSSVEAKPGTGVCATDSHLLWVDKYKPMSSREILGNQESVRKLAAWLARWEERFNHPKAIGKSFSSPQGPWKAALLSGPPGIGKTTTATIVAREAGRDVIEFNASDVRSKKSLKEGLGDITGSQTLEFRKVGGLKKDPPRQKRCIIMDEVDGMGAGDRSGMSELIQMIKNSRVPIICICNDRQSQKMKSLLPYCMDLRYRRPVKSVIASRAVAIAQREGLIVEQNAAEAIAESCGNDVRQVINCMQMWASNNQGQSKMTYKTLKEREHSINKDEILRVSLFDAARVILEGRKGLAGADPKAELSHFFRRNDAFFVDYSFVGLLVQQNYLKVAQGQFTEAKRAGPTQTEAALENMYSAAESMSDFAHAENVLRGGQNWSLLPFTGVLTVKTGFHAGGDSGGFLPGFPEFTAWLGKNSSKGKKTRIIQELQHHANYHVSGGFPDMRMSYIPLFRDRFLSLITNGQNDEAIDLMDEYGFDRDDVFEKLDEFVVDKKAATFASIDSKKKAAFTRTFNERAHKSQALVAEQGAGKLPKRKASSVASDNVDPDAINDDQVPEEEEDDDDEADDAKIVAMFKKKRRGRGGGKDKGKKAAK